jgi:hypothetical protein
LFGRPNEDNFLQRHRLNDVWHGSFYDRGRDGGFIRRGNQSQRGWVVILLKSRPARAEPENAQRTNQDNVK